MANIITASFLLLAIILFINGTFNWNTGGTTYSNMSIWLRGPLFFLVVLGMVLILNQIIHVCCRIMQRFSIGYRLLIIIMWGVLIVAQIVFLCNAGNLLRYDALKIYDEAVSVFYDGGVSATTKEGYFSYYSNNHPILVITFLLLKIGRILHIVAADFSNGMFFLQVINLIAIDVALLFGYFFVKDFFEKESLGIAYMLFALISPLSYIWIPFYYTNTMCMPFYMAGLWIVQRCSKEEGDNEKKKIALLLAAGFLFYIGFAIRATVIITLIALGITILLFFKSIHNKSLLWLSVFVSGMVLGFCVLKPFTEKYIAFDYKNTAFPVIHWIMMGADGEGTFNKKDEAFTAYFATAEDKYNADKIILTQRLQELGAGGTISHAIRKMCLTFSDGTGNYEQELSISDNYGILYRYVYGDSNEGVKTYLQIMHMVWLFCGILAAVKMLRKKSDSRAFVVLCNLLGAFLFYMIWEAGSIYNMGFLPLYYITFSAGMDFNVSDKLPQSNLWKKRIGTAITLLTVVVFLCFGKNTKDDEIVYQVNQYMFQTDNYCECTDAVVLEQTFESDGNFDCISVQARNPLGIENDSTYEMALLNEAGDVLESCQITAGEVADYAFVRFELADAYEKGKYKLTIQKRGGNNNMIWLYYDTGNYDAYKRGALTGLPVESTMDLAFKVYSGTEKEDYFEWYSKEKQNRAE